MKSLVSLGGHTVEGYITPDNVRTGLSAALEVWPSQQARALALFDWTQGSTVPRGDASTVALSIAVRIGEAASGCDWRDSTGHYSGQIALNFVKAVVEAAKSNPERRSDKPAVTSAPIDVAKELAALKAEVSR